MTKITANQIHELYGEFDKKGRKKLKSISDAGEYRKLQHADIQNMSDRELMDLFLRHSEVQNDDAQAIKENIIDLFSEPNSVGQLRQMLIDNQGDVNHILVGYKKLAKIKKIEREIENLEKQKNEINLQLYCSGKTIRTASDTKIDRVHKLENKIKSKQKEKESLLQTKEVVAAYELHKLCGYYDLLVTEAKVNYTPMVYTPSFKEKRDKIREMMLDGQNILLTGPVGTGKTRLAIDIYKEILEEKKKNREIDDAAYQKLSQLCVVNGNEDTSIRDIKSRPIQMSNKEGEENVFTYDEGLLTLCLKYGMPLIIDEANRTSPNFLSSLKKFRALKSGQDYKDEVTGENFPIKARLQVILTSNEGQKYSKDTIKFQDQIERELKRLYVGYMPENELYDLAKAKLYKSPGIAQVTELDLQETLPHFINAVTEINDLYTSGKEYSAADSTSDMKLSSTVLDTKRFLELIDRNKIGYSETFWDELNQKIVEFIQGIEPSDAGDMDRKILCIIFHKNGLLCKENIPDLVRGATNLTAYDLSTIVSSSKSQLKIPRGTRFVNPWQFAKGYGNLINREGDVARHRLANFENLDFEDNGTKLKNLSKSLRALGVLNPITHGQIVSKLNNMDENNLQEILEDVAGIVITDHSEKLSDLRKIIDEADEVVHGVKEKIQNQMLEKMRIRGMAENDAENGGEGGAENGREGGAENDGELEEGEISQGLKDFREAWEERIKNIDDESKEKIIEAAEKIPVKVETESDGSRLIEFKLGGKRWKILDPKLNSHSDDEYKYSLNRDSIKHIDDTVKLGGMRGDDVEEWNNEKLKEYVKEKQREGLHIAKIEEMRDILAELGEKADLDGLDDQIAMLMYLTGMDGRYWLSMGNSEKSGSQDSRSELDCCDDYRYFNYHSSGDYDASLCMIACN